MNIIFLTLSRFTSINDRGIYPDLVRKFCKEGHRVCVVSPMERKFKQKTTLIIQDNLSILKIMTLNIQKTSNIEKGVAYLLLEYQFIRGVKDYFPDIKFDLIMYSTPPITFSTVVKYLKKRDNAKSYLLLKDIFPQAAVDSNLFTDKGLIFRFFRKKEKRLYELSDIIGCMSKANVKYIASNNPEIPREKLEVNPNSIEPVEFFATHDDNLAFRIKNGIPENALIFIYGGNLGKSQGIEFYLEVMKLKASDERVFFITIGSGSEFGLIADFIRLNGIKNSILLKELPKDEYDQLLLHCDVGLIFLSNKFTIPNFPSRLLSYMERKKPVLAATDRITDIGEIISNNEFGYWTLHGDTRTFLEKMDLLITQKSMLEEIGRNGYNYLLKHYTVDTSYNEIIKHFKNV